MEVARWLRTHRFELALVCPLFLYVFALTVAPILDTVRLSLTAPRGGGFPSLASYRALLESAVFGEAVVNTLIVALLSIALQLGFGLAIALALHVNFRGRALVRTVMLLPLGIPTIVAGAAMLMLFARAGYLNALLFHAADAVGWRFTPTAWTVAGGWRTLVTVAVADSWKVLPVVTLILLAGLQAIPREVDEAASVDGAGRWQRLARVTLPLLLPYLTMAVILRAIDAFRIFELALVLAGRVEPVLGTYIWSRYAPPTSDPFTAAAAAMVLFAMILVFVALYLRLAGEGAGGRA